MRRPGDLQTAVKRSNGQSLRQAGQERYKAQGMSRGVRAAVYQKAVAAAACPDAAEQVQGGEIVELVEVKNTWCALWLFICVPSVPAWCNSGLVVQCMAHLLADGMCHSMSPKLVLEHTYLRILSAAPSSGSVGAQMVNTLSQIKARERR